MGSKIPVIMKAIKTGNMKLADGKYHIYGEEEMELNKEDILVSYKAKSNMPVMSDGEVIVSLNLEITEELEQEGTAREIVRNIQDTRKALNLEITDRIFVQVEGVLPEKWISYICNETLGDLAEITEATSTFTLEDKNITVKIKTKN